MHAYDDTSIGGRRAAFPLTPASAVHGVRSTDPVARGRAFHVLVQAYWKAIYKHVRLKWRKSNEEAKDVTQSFFARALEKGVFEAYDPNRAKFRTFVRTCLDNYVATQLESEGRIKRGGHATLISLDFDEAEDELGPCTMLDTASIEEEFDRQWVRSLHAASIEGLRERLGARGKEVYFRIFEQYDLAEDTAERPTYDSLAATFGIKVTDVTNHLAAARRELRLVVLDKLRQITASEEEFQSEARLVLGVDVTS